MLKKFLNQLNLGLIPLTLLFAFAVNRCELEVTSISSTAASLITSSYYTLPSRFLKQERKGIVK